MNGNHILAAGVGLVVVGAAEVAAPFSPAISVFVVGAVASLLVGTVAAHLAASAMASPKSVGLSVGLAAGVGACIATAVALATVGVVAISVPGMPDTFIVDTWVQDGLRSNDLLMVTLGVLGGLAVGAWNLVFATAGGLLGGTLATRQLGRTAAE